MMQAMDADFEAAVRQTLAQCGGNGVIPRNKIEGGAETEALFELRQLITFIQTFGRFHIMGQDKGEFLSIRPASPSFRRFAGIMIDGPDVFMGSPFPPDKISPQPDLQPPGDEEFESVVGFGQEHRFNR
jgi:hypothetical protein